MASLFWSIWQMMISLAGTNIYNSYSIIYNSYSIQDSNLSDFFNQKFPVPRHAVQMGM